MLIGRALETDALDRAIEAARSGRSRALVVRGEAGVGKTALLNYAAEHASGCRLARAAGVESEMELAFAAMHQLCGSMVDRFDRLPDPQRAALDCAFGRVAGPPPSPFLVGLAVLNLFAEIAAERPLVCIVDDAQWLDRASARVLGFVARRVLAESVVLIFGVREPADDAAFHGLTEITVGGLSPAAARELLETVIRGPLDAEIRDLFVAETQGNPLALLELPSSLGPTELAGGFGLPAASSLSARIEESFARRIRKLPEFTQRLLVVAATDPAGDPELLWRAAEVLHLSVDQDSLEPAADLVVVGTRVTFRHPLVRSASYWAASAAQRRSAHSALAEAMDPERDPDRRAWHRAHATTSPDAGVADDLERCAGRARARGGLAAAAAFLEHSARLTSEGAVRGARLLAAAIATHEAGVPLSALELVDQTKNLRLDALQRARADLLRGEIAFTLNRGEQAPRLLLRAAEQLVPIDLDMARRTFLQALLAAWFVGRLATAEGVVDVARAARSAPSPMRCEDQSRPPRIADLLLDGYTRLIIDGRDQGLPLLRRAVDLFDTPDVTVEEVIQWSWLGLVAAADLWDDKAWRRLAVSYVEVARGAGALSALPLALSQRFVVHLHEGELSQAASAEQEAGALTAAMGARVTPYGTLALAAWRGELAEARALIEASSAEATSRGEGMGLTVAHWAGAVLHNGLEQYDEALAAALAASANASDPSGAPSWALGELVEAAVRSGHPAAAVEALRKLTDTTTPAGTDWALALLARTRALMSDGPTAEPLYREAIARFGRTCVRVELARAHLLYGEWLRSRHRRLEARAELRAAHQMFTQMGVHGFAERAARQLYATGERAPTRPAGTPHELTPQEEQIARLAGEHLTNAEIGVRLFLSPRTIEYHLAKVFAKLQISSRNQLHIALSELDSSR